MANARVAKLVTTYRENVWPAMVDSLAADLGVSAESLYRLNIGFAPVVQFSKRTMARGWWVFPELDDQAEVTGAILRDPKGGKCMIPGSKPGLFYPIAEDHRAGRVPYRHGSHNWERTSPGGHTCPICGRQDYGCLVASVDPSDPPAAVCCRVKENSVKSMKIGFLHILKPEGDVDGKADPLPHSEHPVLVVEGASDVAAALDLGFVAVGRHSSSSSLDTLVSLLRGRDVIVLGENDRTERGDTPGIDGMNAAWEVLRTVCPSCVKCLPPERFKDLRQWKNKGGLTAEDLLAHIEQAGQDFRDENVFERHDTLLFADSWIRTHHKLGDRLLLRRYNQEFVRWTEANKYEVVDDEADIRGGLYNFLADKQYFNETSKGPVIEPIKLNSTLINNCIDSLSRYCPVNGTPPMWLNGAKGPDPARVIAFANGLLDIDRYLDGDTRGCMLEGTPDFFTTIALPMSFDPDADWRPWQDWLTENTVDGHDTLQEWFGYNMVPDMRFQKLMVLRGPRRAGKGACLHALRSVLGRDQISSTTFSQLSTPFGTWNLVNKLAVLMEDAVTTSKGDMVSSTQLILTLVGGGAIDVNRKNQRFIQNYQPFCRFTMAVNELPELPDNANALAARLLVTEFPNSYVGREDYDLYNRIESWAPAIVNWGLHGLRRLYEQGRFTEPPTQAATLEEWRHMNSPVAAFLEECCEAKAEAEVGKRELYDAWLSWSSERGIRPISKTLFFNRVVLNVPTLRKTFEAQGTKHSVFSGLRLQSWARKALLTG